jgi:nucleoside-diphosphate-sugar epimerase
MNLVTGAKGWIGSKLHEKVGGIGIDVREGKNLLSCELPENIDVIYHLAAQSSVEASWADPLHDLDNIRITARLVHKYPNAKIIYTNSAASLDKSSPYGFSKWAAGEYIKKFHTNYVICTLPNVYGHGSRSVVDAFKGKKKVTVYGTGDHTRSYVHVFDIVDGLVMAQNWPVGEYMMGSGVSTRVIDLARGKEVIS